MGAVMVFDEESGIAYEGYNAELMRAFLILVYYTDLDLVGYDTMEGRQLVYDTLSSHGLWDNILQIVNEDMRVVAAICMQLAEASKRNFEHKQTMEYKLSKVFESLLGTENLVETIAKAEGLNSKLIDLLGAMQTKKPATATGLRFDKKAET